MLGGHELHDVLPVDPGPDFLHDHLHQSTRRPPAAPGATRFPVAGSIVLATRVRRRQRHREARDGHRDASPATAGPATCPCPCPACPCPRCSCRAWPCGLRHPQGPCHAPCRAGLLARRPGSWRHRRQLFEVQDQPSGMLWGGCLAGSRPAPLHVLVPPPPCWSRCPPRPGRGRPRRVPPAARRHRPAADRDGEAIGPQGLRS